MKSIIKKKISFFLVSLLLVFTIINSLGYLNIYAINTEKSSEFNDDGVLDKKNFRISALSYPIHIIGNSGWVDFKNDGNCTGSGTYSDPYVIEDLVIDGGGSGSCIWIDNSNVYFRIENCTVYNAGSSAIDAGIKLNQVSNGLLINNTASNNNNLGIGLYSCDNSTISENVVKDSSKSGILLHASDNNTISENIVKDSSEYGIHLYDSSNNTISGNTANNNDYNGIHLYDHCNYNIITGNRVHDNTDTGIYLLYGHYNDISGNNASYNNAGIWLAACDNSTISGNTATNNINQGIDIFQNDNNTIKGNIANNNYEGIYLYDSTNILVFNNSLIGNIENGYEYLGTNNRWDNGIIGNYWGDYGDYGGTDANDDGIGDTPYTSIYEGSGSQDNYPIWWDPPVISIISPVPNDVFSTTPPDFNISIAEGIKNTTWYTLDNGLTNTTFTGLTGTINQTVWDNVLIDFPTIEFYANDSLGYIGSATVIVEKDIVAPQITINSPTPNQLCGVGAPTFSLTIVESNIQIKRYSLNGRPNITFTSETQFDQPEWDNIGNGTVLITFYVIDKGGNVNSSEVIVRKDIIVPDVTINFPISDEIFGRPPNLDVDITDPNIDRMWYTLDDVATKYFFTMGEVPFSIALNAWNSRPDGMITIKVYANDTVSNEIFEEVSIEKDTIRPEIMIIKPGFNDDLGDKNAPTYQIDIDELNIDEIWYSLDGGANNYTITLLEGAINLEAWNDANYGIVTITFYVRDKAGNIGTKDVSVNKIESPKEDFITMLLRQGILIPLVGGIVGGSVGLAFYYLRRRKKKAEEP